MHAMWQTCKFSRLTVVKFCQLVKKKWQVLILTLMLMLAAAHRLNDLECQRIQASTLLATGNYGKVNPPVESDGQVTGMLCT